MREHLSTSCSPRDLHAISSCTACSCVPTDGVQRGKCLYGKCWCDPGFTGNDCAGRMCPRGDDPLTKNCPSGENCGKPPGDLNAWASQGLD